MLSVSRPLNSRRTNLLIPVPLTRTHTTTFVCWRCKYTSLVSLSRHCLSPYGEACYECALSKGDDKGVPLVERNETGSKQVQSSASHHIVPASSGGYGQQYPYGGYQGHGQPQQGHGHTSQSYNQRIYPQQNWQAVQSKRGFPAQPNQGLPAQQNQRFPSQQNKGFQFSYSSSGNSRKRRSTSHRMEKFTIQIPANLTSAQPILRLVPVLSEFNGTFNYLIVHGNTSLFKVEQRDGISYLHLKTPLHRKGVFRLWIKGVLHEPKAKKAETKNKRPKRPGADRHQNRIQEKENGTKKRPHASYNKAKKFSLHLVIKAV